MTPTVGSGTGGDAEFLAGLGQAQLDLAREWQDVQKRGLNTHSLGLLREVYGAISLQLAVRASELRGQGDARQALEQLRRIESDLRAEFADAVAMVKR